MTFKQWWKEYCLEQFAKAECSPEPIYEEIWDAGFLEGLGYANDRMQEQNKTIENLRNLRMKYPERTIEDDI